MQLFRGASPVISRVDYISSRLLGRPRKHEIGLKRCNESILFFELMMLWCDTVRWWYRVVMSWDDMVIWPCRMVMWRYVFFLSTSASEWGCRQTAMWGGFQRRTNGPESLPPRAYYTPPERRASQWWARKTYYTLCWLLCDCKQRLPNVKIQRTPRSCCEKSLPMCMCNWT